MGNDGGSIPKRDDLVKTKHRCKQVNLQEKESTRWSSCALSKRPLEEPIVSDPLGKLYNKSAALEFLIDRDHYGEDGRQVAGHLSSMKDLVNLRLMKNASSTNWICPISLKEMGAGVGKMETRWIYLIDCGCVLTETGLKQITGGSVCPVCGIIRTNTSVVTINPTQDEEQLMMIQLIEQQKKDKEMRDKRRLEKKEQKKRKKDPIQLDPPDDKLHLLTHESDRKTSPHTSSKRLKSKLVPLPTPDMQSSSMDKITREIKQETQQSLVKLSSSTMNSIYGPRDANGKQLLGQQKESWMTRGTWTRYAA